MISIKTFIKNYSKEISEGNAAIFAGAGLSVSAGFVSWKELLRDIADELHLDVDKEHDLVALAQYHLNENQNRSQLNQRIIEKFTAVSKLNLAHKYLSDLPIGTYWTTNYDNLIETSLEQNNKKVDKKIDQRSLANNVPSRDAVVYKMHGDVLLPSEAIITKDDYETYNEKRQLFTTALQGDLVSKTFLFIGFSFEDPNLSYILSRIRVLLGANKRSHYAFFRNTNKSDYSDERTYIYAQTKQALLIQDLKRYAINAIMLDEYNQIPEILLQLKKRINIRNVFISGSAVEYGTWTQEDAVKLITGITSELISAECKVITGFGLGIGSFVINSAIQIITEKKYSHFDNYLEINPFPFQLSTDQKEAFNKKYRDSILDHSGIAIFIFGNKSDGSKTIVADGVLNEYRIAREKGLYIIPIGSTNYAAKEIFDEVASHISEFEYLRTDLEILKSETKIPELLSAVKRILKIIIGGTDGS